MSNMSKSSYIGNNETRPMSSSIKIYLKFIYLFFKEIFVHPLEKSALLIRDNDVIVLRMKANLQHRDLSSAILRDVCLRGADLSGANLSKVDFSRADLREANLSDANLSESNLEGADFRKANLKCADLRRARYRTADFAGTEMEGTLYDVESESTSESSFQ